MKLAFITPTAYLQKYATQGDFYLALAHLIDDDGKNDYASFHRREAEKGRRVILDNGLFEGAQVDPLTLIRRARAIKAQTVFAPDVLYDCKGTIKAFKSFVKLALDEGFVCDIAGVPQASTPAEWWECFQFMDMHEACSLIGLSILSIPKSFRASIRGSKRPITDSRCHIIRQLYAYTDISGRRLTPCHLLGLGESYDDIKLANELLSRDIVSNDSSSAFVHGIKGIRYREDGSIPGGKNHEKLDFDLKLAYPMIVGGDKRYDKTMENIQYNINIAKEIAGDR